jgi:transcriptional regulator with XRE-family HTH domain
VPPPEAALDANKPVSGITLADSLFPPEESPALDKDALGRAVGRRIRRLRRERQWTQQQLCRKVGAPRSYISRMENARLTPGLAMLYRIAAALEVEMVDLLTHDARRNSAEEFWGFLARSLSRLHSQQISAVLCHVRRMARANTPCRLAS